MKAITIELGNVGSKTGLSFKFTHNDTATRSGGIRVNNFQNNKNDSTITKN